MFHPEEPRAPSQGNGSGGTVNLLSFIHFAVVWVYHLHVYTSSLTKEYLQIKNANQVFFLICFFFFCGYTFCFLSTKIMYSCFKKSHDLEKA